MSSALFSFGSFHTIFNSPMRFARTSHVEDAVFVAAELVIVHKEFFKFFYKLFAEIIYILNVSVTVIFLLDRDHSVVLFNIAFLFALLALDNSDNTTG